MEEKKRKIQRTTQSLSTISSHDNDTSQSDHIPLELTLDILSRLPVKSVGRCRSVSKLWSTITTTQDFLDSCATRSSPPSVLITIKRGDILLLFSPPLHKNSLDGPLSCLGSYQWTMDSPIDSFIQYGICERFDYVRGLFLLQGWKKLVLWNPTVKRFFTLPEPKGTQGNNKRSPSNNSIGGVLGYDKINGKYIVLRVLRNSKICILTLGAQGKKSRRTITNGFPEHRAILRCGPCINGVMYYQANVSVGVGFMDRIMSFDVRSEKFNEITYPEGYCYESCYMVSYEGRLAIVEIRKFPCYLWILENGDRHEWTRKSYVLPISETHLIRDQEKEFYGVSDAGELVFAQKSLSQSFNILYFDLRRNSIRKVSFDVGDEFRRRYGLIGKNSMYNMKVYSNHIESLVPL